MANFWSQANALFHKNLTYHRRHARSHLKVILFPVILFVFLGGMQIYFDKQDLEEVDVKIPNEDSSLLQIPSSNVRAVADNFIQFPGFPDASCRETDSCPVTILITGTNRSLAESVAGKMFIDTPDPKSISDVDAIANGVFGTNGGRVTPLIHVQARCSKNSSSDFICVQGLNLWRNSSLDINTELFKGYSEGNTEGKTNELLAAYDSRIQVESISSSLYSTIPLLWPLIEMIIEC